MGRDGLVDGIASCTGRLPTNHCSLTLSTLGSHNLVASYSGDCDFMPTVSPGVTHSVVNRTPSLTLLEPSSALIYTGPFTLTVWGADFMPGSVVRWSGADRPTAFVGDSDLRASIGASDLTLAGDISVTVFNPAPGGGSSGSLPFRVEKRRLHLPLVSY